MTILSTEGMSVIAYDSFLVDGISITGDSVSRFNFVAVGSFITNNLILKRSGSVGGVGNLLLDGVQILSDDVGTPHTIEIESEVDEGNFGLLYDRRIHDCQIHGGQSDGLHLDGVDRVHIYDNMGINNGISSQCYIFAND